MSDLLTRIQEIIGWSTLGPAAFADEIGVARPVVSHILSGRNKASLEVVQKLLTRYPEISAKWLLAGEGPMLMTLGRILEPKEDQGVLTESKIKNVVPEGFVQEQGKVQNVEKGSSEEIRTTNKAGRTLVKVVLLYSDGSFESFDSV
ncbi:helix-turn-helix domain-containing protein [Rufibacter latericius]|uniref:helix-turn-helix domain-containing protein n=1 Tax=Rufibacter latericius TaxID=2487040 RepID=UPI001402757E|nr:helix-turn-helix transcriptional regulator [Rufibacter latericius]